MRRNNYTLYILTTNTKTIQEYLPRSVVTLEFHGNQPFSYIDIQLGWGWWDSHIEQGNNEKHIQGAHSLHSHFNGKGYVEEH